MTYVDKLWNKDDVRFSIFYLLRFLKSSERTYKSKIRTAESRTQH